MHRSLVFQTLAAFVFATSTAFALVAPNARGVIDQTVIEDIKEKLSSDIVEVLVKAQNERYRDLDQAEIDALDTQWRNEREASDKPLIAATLSNPLSSYLIRVQAQSLGLYSEIFVMDANGLNVGQSAITSDYWQGDEAKFQKTFPVSADAVFVDEAEWHKDTRTWRAQVNLTVVDAAGASIGAATFEINLSELARRKGRQLGQLNTQ